MGIVRSSLTVNPFLVNALDMACLDTAMEWLLASFSESCPRVKSGCSSSHPDSDSTVDGVILQTRAPPRGLDAVVPLVS